MVPPIIGKSRAIRNINTLISRVAPTGENILIHGETGAGKDLVAQSLYHQSKRVGKPFVKVNCASLTDSLFETEISCFDQTGTKDASKNDNKCQIWKNYKKLNIHRTLENNWDPNSISVIDLDYYYEQMDLAYETNKHQRDNSWREKRIFL